MGLAVISSLDYRPADNKLIIGTHGNGMFETTVENTLSVNSYSELVESVENELTVSMPAVPVAPANDPVVNSLLL